MATIEHFIGVDLHKAVIQVCVLDLSGAVVHEQRFTGASLEDGRRVIEELAHWKETGRVAVEAISFNRWFVDGCRQAGLQVVVVDPTHLGLRMLGRKTDRRDAHEIARRLLLGDIDRNARSYFATDDEYAQRRVLRTRKHLVELRHDLVNQIRALLGAHRVPAPAGSLYGPRNLVVLRSLELPDPALGRVLAVLVESLQSLHGQVEQLDEEIGGMAGQPAIAAMTELPSLGPQTAATLVSELGDVRRFRSARAVTSYAGLAPRVCNSADKQHHGPLTKRGNAHLRHVLGQWAVRLLARDELVQRWAAPLLRRMHKNKVRMALARRLLIGVYVMLLRGEVFRLDRCLGLAAA
jgi:transposase